MDMLLDLWTVFSLQTVVTGCLVMFVVYRIYIFSKDVIVFISLGSICPKPPVEKKGVVYLYAFPRQYVRQLPNMSPFAIKTETWLRMKGIKYEFVGTMKMSERTQMIPYIHLDGEEIPDSNFIIQHLTSYFKLDEIEGMSAEELAVGHAFIRMLDEHTSWTYIKYRFMDHPENFTRVSQYPVSKFMRRRISAFLTSYIGNRCKAQGIGRKTLSEAILLGTQDIQALSAYLGDKDFVFGDTPSLVDCAAFGHLCFLFHDGIPIPHKETLASCPNIMPYLHRIKDRFWPDWSELVNNQLFSVD